MIYSLRDPHNNDELVGTEVSELLETVCKNRFVVDFDHSLGFALGEPPVRRLSSAIPIRRNSFVRMRRLHRYDCR
jgi:hypothetical protein